MDKEHISYISCAENVGCGPVVRNLHKTVHRLNMGFIKSKKHYINYLSNFDTIGVGICISPDNTMFITQVFCKPFKKISLEDIKSKILERIIYIKQIGNQIIPKFIFLNSLKDTSKQFFDVSEKKGNSILKSILDNAYTELKKKSVLFNFINSYYQVTSLEDLFNYEFEYINQAFRFLSFDISQNENGNISTIFLCIH